MNFEARTYTGLDIVRLPFKVAPFLVGLQLVLSLVQAVIPTAVLALATAFFVNTAIAIFEGQAAASTIYLPLGILLAVVGLDSVLRSVPRILESRIKFALDRTVIPAILDVQARLAYKHIEDADSWELIKRVTDDLRETFQEGISAYATMIRSIAAITAILGLIITQVWWAALVFAAFSVPLFWIAFWAGKKNYAAKVESLKYERRYSYYSEEVLTTRENAEERTLFGYANTITKRFYDHFVTAAKIQLWVLLKIRIAMKSAGIALALIAALIALTLIHPVIAGDISPGMFMGIVAVLFRLAQTLGGQLQNAAEDISMSNEYMRDLTTLIQLDSDDGATDLPDKEPIVFESLECKNVRFKYPTGDDYIFDGLSFTLERGKHYAFVGANGAGKTTITKLLTRLYDEYDGEIFINGKELRTYTSSALKALFSVVYQDFARYQIALADNIALGDAARDIDTQHIHDIAAQVELNDTISNLAHGANTPLGKLAKEGADISGGQWQKVAIGRSLISRAPIKILDEPMAALDPIAESQIYQKFETLMKGKTTIFISHRLGSTKLADEILVLDKGSIVERGSHSELMKMKGLYAQMYETQREWYE